MARDGNLHQISVKIGALEAQADEGARQRSAIFSELKAQTKQLGEIATLLQQMPTLQQRLAAVEASVGNFERLCQRGVGFLAAAGLAGGLVGGTASEMVGKLVKKLLGGP